MRSSTVIQNQYLQIYLLKRHPRLDVALRPERLIETVANRTAFESQTKGRVLKGIYHLRMKPISLNYYEPAAILMQSIGGALLPK